MNDGVLDNVMWHVLTGPQARFASGGPTAKRYAPGFSPILAFPDMTRPDFDALRPYVAVGESLYCGGWTHPAPAGWTIQAEATMVMMLWSGGLPEQESMPEAAPLQPQHAAAALELAELTKPGPFGPRTLELGEYFGVFDDAGQLIAMAGERMHAAHWREVSGVCTRPGHQGRGLARRLMLKLIRRQVQRGEVPFLHVMTHNATALGLYLRMGFEVRHESVVRVVSVLR
jgi:GNAT superfamily N-acetyltransferase